MDAVTADGTLEFDLRETTVRALNQFLHGPAATLAGRQVQVHNTDGAHNLAVGLNAAAHVTLHGHAGYYAAGMNKFARVTVEGSASTGVAENMMSGLVHVKGCAWNGACSSASSMRTPLPLSSSRRRATSFVTAVDTSTVFVPDCRRTRTAMHAFPSRRARDDSASKPSSARPTSRSFTAAPPLSATTSSSNASALSNSAASFVTTSRGPVSILPPATSTC